MGKKIMAGIVCAMLCLLTGCSSEETEVVTQQKNDEGYIVTELTTAVSDNPDGQISEGSSAIVSEVPVSTKNDSTQLSNNGTVTSSWFDDAVFVGDSVTLKLNYYCDAHPEALGNVKFFCAGSMGYNNTQLDENDKELIRPYYKGATQKTEECAVVTKSTKVFVMLGMNDIGLYGVDGSLESARTLLTKIHENSPDAVIYVQSVTPILEGFEGETWNNTLIQEFNGKLQELSDENGYHYLDIYSIMADESGHLRKNYCGDPEALGIHFTEQACEVWCDYLKNHV
ncbi:MAG: hypothetical protein IJU14_01105 [Clostridia bacterium]|nr:hypothetical protein [Clostridia bacterium]